MTKTSLDVATEALQHLGICGIGEDPASDDSDRAKEHLDDLFETLSTTHELALTWTVDTVPAGAFLPLSIMLSGAICGAYGKPNYMGEYKRGLGLLREFEFGKMKTDSQPIRANYF